MLLINKLLELTRQYYLRDELYKVCGKNILELLKKVCN